MTAHEEDLEKVEHVLQLAKELTETDEARWHEVHDRIWAARPAEALKVVRGWMRALNDRPELRQQLIEKLPTWRRP